MPSTSVPTLFSLACLCYRDWKTKIVNLQSPQLPWQLGLHTWFNFYWSFILELELSHKERRPWASVWELSSVGSKRRVVSISVAGLGLGRTGLVWELVLWGVFSDWLASRLWQMPWSWWLWHWLPIGEDGLLIQQLSDDGRGSSSLDDPILRWHSEFN